VCQSSEALFHFVICCGSVQYFHTLSTGVWTVVSTVTFQKQLKQDFIGKRVFVFSVPNIMIGKLNRVQNFYKQAEIPMEWVDRVAIHLTSKAFFH
jgi:hypothetical protein